MKQKKGQIKFGETIGVIFIVYIIVVMGFIWYNKTNSDDLAERMEKDRKDQAFEKYNYIVKLNLIHRSELTYIDEEFDLASLKTMEMYSKSTDGKRYFEDKLKNSRVTVKLYDLEKNPIDNITLYNRTPTKKYNVERYKTIIPVNDGVNNTKYLGIIEVEDFQVIN